MPSTQKITITSISILAVFWASSGSVHAQNEMLPSGEGVGFSASETFSDSDINNDGVLDREEFLGFAASKAKQGDINYGALIVSGDYDNAFNTRDYNADGLLTLEEMKLPDASHLMEGDAPEVGLDESEDEMAVEE